MTESNASLDRSIFCRKPEDPVLSANLRWLEQRGRRDNAAPATCFLQNTLGGINL